MKAALGVLLALLLCSREAAAFQFGVCVHLAMARSDAATVLRLVEEGGFNSIRDDAYWSGVERSEGVLEFPARYSESRARDADAGATRPQPRRDPRVRQPVP